MAMASRGQFEVFSGTNQYYLSISRTSSSFYPEFIKFQTDVVNRSEMLNKFIKLFIKKLVF